MNHRILQILIAQPILFSFFILSFIPLQPAYTTVSRLPSFQKANEKTALTNVTLIDGNGGQPKSNQTLIVSEGRISDVFAAGSKEIPTDAKVVDLSGKFVMPGLIDTHVHLGTQERPPGVMKAILRLSLLGGVTSVRDMGGNGVLTASLAGEANKGLIPSPRIYYSTFITGTDSDFYMNDAEGRFVTNGTPPGTSVWFRRIAADSDLVKVIADAKAFGATGIKIHSGVSASLLKQLCLEAHRQGLKVWSHAAITPAKPGEAVEAGVEVLSHTDMLAFEAEKNSLVLPEMKDYRIRALNTIKNVPVESEVITKLLKRMKAKGVILEPTLLVWVNFEAHASDEENRQRLKTHVEYSYQMTRRANEIGVTLTAGTDHIGGSSPNIHAELQLLVSKSGLTPLEAITAGTRNGARAIGIEKDYGTLEKGKFADLVILSANPAADIRNTQTIEYVMQGGKLYKREEPFRTPPFAEPPLGTGTPKNN